MLADPLIPIPGPNPVPRASTAQPHKSNFPAGTKFEMKDQQRSTSIQANSATRLMIGGRWLLAIMLTIACTLQPSDDIALENAIATDVEASKSGCADWPMWRYDAQRSSSSPNQVPTDLELLWTKSFGKRTPVWDDPLNQDLMTYDHQFEPIIADGRIYLGFNDQDKIIALDLTTGEKLWTFFGEGPFRLPPVAHDGRLYATCDDGFLYCLDGKSGELIWKFFGAPNAQKILGNRRLISAWPARGGAVIEDGLIYFANSIWPFMGTFIYALDANTGEVKWINDSTGSQYIKQPHSAPAFAGVAPQGAFVISGDRLVVPGGRSVPAVFNKADGGFQYFELNAGGKGNGGAFVAADRLHFYVHTRLKGTRAFNLESGLKTAFTPNEPVIDGDIIYSATLANGDAKGVPTLVAYQANLDSDKDRVPLWSLNADGTQELIGAGNHLVAAGKSSIQVIEKPRQVDGAIEGGSVVATIPIQDVIVRMICGNDKLVVVTDNGDINVYGKSGNASSPSPAVHESNFAALEEPNRSNEESNAPNSDSEWTERWASIPQIDGYVLWFGSPSDSELRGLAKNASKFEEVAVVSRDEAWVKHARKLIDDLGIYGKITVRLGEPVSYRLPPYIASHIVVSDPVLLTLEHRNAFRAVYESLRPYGGQMLVKLNGNQVENSVPTSSHNASSELKTHTEESLAVEGAEEGLCLSELPLEEHLRQLAIDQLRLENAAVEQSEFGPIVVRVGALPGSSDWTHQYGDVGNTIKSNDKRVKLPLGVLWFGASSNMDVLPRHGHGPSQQVVGGRLYIQGMNSLSARDVYTGRVLWKREFEDLGTFDIYYDETYEDTPLDPKYNQVHIPGANGRGTNYIVTEDRIYLIIANECLILDPITGEDLGKIAMPVNEEGETPEWGYIGVYKDTLFGGVGFANYKDKHGLVIESDEGLTGNKKGFGSKSLDRAASRGLIAFDRKSGEMLWKLDAIHSFWHNGIVAGNDRLYLLDRNPATIEEALKRRGRKLPDTYRIVSVDHNTGEQLWEIKESIFGTWLGYSEKHDLLLQAGSKASDRLKDEVGKGMRVYTGKTGDLKWAKDDLSYSGPCIIHNETIITNANAYAPSAGAFNLLTGQQRMIRNPITGREEPWKIVRAYGCNNIIASEYLLTFRSGSAGYLDLESDGGTGNLGGFKSGCTSNLIVANGVLNAPDYTRTCSCAYQNQTSIAMVHMPDIDQWSVHPATNLIPPGTPIETLSLNLGAPGDRRDSNGELWIEHPPLAGEAVPIAIETNPEVKYFQQHPSSVGNDSMAWVYSSGAIGITQLKLGLRGIELAKEDEKNEKATADKENGQKEAEAKTVVQDFEGTYDIKLFLAVPRDHKRSVFDVWLQGKLVRSEVVLTSADDGPSPDSQYLKPVSFQPKSTRLEIVIPAQLIRGTLDLRLKPIEGLPVLNGIQLIKTTSGD